MSKGKAIGKVAGKALNKVNPVEALREVLTSYVQYAKVREQEVTKRHEISADLETSLASIRAQQEIVLTYLDRSFAERDTIFREKFKLADAALQSGDSASLATVVQGIIEVAKSSPLAALGDLAKTQAMLRNKDTEWSA